MTASAVNVAGSVLAVLEWAFISAVAAFGYVNLTIGRYFRLNAACV